MRVVQVSTHEAVGGAARAALRLNRALRATGVDSVALVRSRTGLDDGAVQPASRRQRLASLLAPIVDGLVLRWTGAAPDSFSRPMFPDFVPTEIRRLGGEIVNLHWVGHSFLRPEALARFGRPVVWTLHDSWPFTGGCHVPGTCERYRERCGCCPVLPGRRDRDASRRLWNRKERAWRRVDLTVVTPSKWMADRAAASSLLRGRRVEVIPNAIDLDRYRSLPRAVARQALGIPDDGRAVVLFGAYGGTRAQNKGLDLLLPALGQLAHGGVPLRLVVMGGEAPAGDEALAVSGLGVLSDEVAVALANAAADVVAVPSRQENLPNAVMEAQACARPVVAFRIGGIPEMVEDGRTGRLAAPFEPAGLAEAIRWVVSDPARWSELCAAARTHAEAAYSPSLQAHRYAALYDELLSATRAKRP